MYHQLFLVMWNCSIKIIFKKTKRYFTRVLHNVLTFVILCACIAVITTKIQLYISSPTTFSTTIEDNYFRELPLVTICPWPQFHPLLLRKYGLNVSGDMYRVQEQHRTLSGCYKNNTAAFIWEHAGWRVDDVVKAVQRGYANFQISNNRNLSKWRRMFTYHGPCFTYFPAVNETSVTIFLEEIPTIPDCSIIEPMKSDLERKLCFHREIEKEYRGFYDFLKYKLYRIEKFKIFLHETHQSEHFKISENVQIIEQNIIQNFFDGNFQIEGIETDGILSKVKMERHNYLITKCSNNKKRSQNNCYEKCLRDGSLESYRCEPFTYIIKNESLDLTCISYEILDDIGRFGSEKCRQKCLPSCRRLLYVHEIVPISSSELLVTLQLDSPKVTTTTEALSYPFSKLLSDFGGIISLFMGISSYLVLVIIWRFWISKIKVSKSFIYLSHESFIISTISFLTIGGTALNFVLTLYFYFYQPPCTSALIKNMNSPLSSLASDEEHLQKAVIKRLASRPLGCRPSESAFTECFVDCTIRSIHRELLFVTAVLTIKDLKDCDDEYSSIPSRRVLLQGEVLNSFAISEKTNYSKCIHVCEREPKNIEHNKTTFRTIEIEDQFYPITLFSLIARLGGALGLYLGISLFDLTVFLQRFSIPIKLKLGIIKVIKGISVVTAAIMCAWQVHFYLINHQTEVISKFGPLNEEHVPTLSFCMWPPFNLKKLKNLTGVDITRGMDLKNITEQQKFLALRLKELPVYFNASIDNNIWNSISWDVQELLSMVEITYGEQQLMLLADCDHEMACDTVFTSQTTFLNKCFTINVSKFDFISSAKFYISRKHTLKNRHTVYLAVHSKESLISVESMYPLPYQREAIAFVTTSYYQRPMSTQRNSIDYNSCVVRCYSYLMSEKYQCKLPYMSWISKFNFCNYSQYFLFPQLMFHMPRYSDGHKIVMVVGPDSSSSELSHVLARCYQVCRQTLGVHHGVSLFKNSRYSDFTELKVDFEPLMTHRSKRALTFQENDLYILGDVVSDMGSFLGLTIGTSILSIVHSLIP